MAAAKYIGVTFNGFIDSKLPEFNLKFLRLVIAVKKTDPENNRAFHYNSYMFFLEGWEGVQRTIKERNP